MIASVFSCVGLRKEGKKEHYSFPSSLSPPPSCLEGNDQVTCVVCMKRAREYAFFPCKHFVACSECRKTEKCYICRKKIRNSVRIFLS